MVSHFYQFGEWWELSQTLCYQVPAQGQSCQQVFLRRTVSGLLCSLFFCTQAKAQEKTSAVGTETNQNFSRAVI